MGFSCSEFDCVGEAKVGGLCIKCYKEDYQRRNKERKKMREPEKGGKVDSGEKGCKRCKKNRHIIKSKGVCVVCNNLINKCKREGREVPEYTGKRGGKRTPVKKKKKDAIVVEPARRLLSALEDTPGEATLTIDFTGREELLERIKDMAFEDCRTVEMEIVAILKETLEGER